MNEQIQAQIGNIHYDWWSIKEQTNTTLVLSFFNYLPGTLALERRDEQVSISSLTATSIFSNNSMRIDFKTINGIDGFVIVDDIYNITDQQITILLLNTSNLLMNNIGKYNLQSNKEYRDYLYRVAASAFYEDFEDPAT